MLNGFKADDQVHAVVFQWHVCGTALQKAQIVRNIFAARAFHRRCIDVDPRHLRGIPGQHGRAVTVAAGDIQHGFARGKLAGQQVPVQMLQGPVPVKFRQIAFSRTFHIIPSGDRC